MSIAGNRIFSCPGSSRLICTHNWDSAPMYGYRMKRTRVPVRSLTDKLHIGGLVVGRVTTSEFPLLYISCLFCFGNFCSFCVWDGSLHWGRRGGTRFRQIRWSLDYKNKLIRGSWFSFQTLIFPAIVGQWNPFRRCCDRWGQNLSIPLQKKRVYDL